MSRWEVLEEVTERLESAGVPSPQVDAERIVAHVEERFGGDLRGCDAHVLASLVERRVAREPLQLVLGRTWFRHLELGCTAGVFVPRPETEVVAGVAIDAARALPSPVVVEPCTGTGAIALSLFVEVPGVRVHATDRSEEAIALARANHAEIREGRGTTTSSPTGWRPGSGPAPDATVTFAVGDLLAPVDPALRGQVDVLVANPPYLPASDADTWDPEVADHDPHTALVGGPDGHEVVDRLLAAAATWLRPGGTVVVEIDDRRGAEALVVATRAGLVAPRLVQDLTGRDRAIVARREERP